MKLLCIEDTPDGLLDLAVIAKHDAVSEAIAQGRTFVWGPGQKIFHLGDHNLPKSVAWFFRVENAYPDRR